MTISPSSGSSTSCEHLPGVVATPGQPAVVSFNLLLDVAARKGRVKLLRISGCQSLMMPGTESTACMFVRQGQWFSKMQELGIESDAETFRALIMGTVKSAEGDLETAETLESN